jgi:hypothetical protein
VASPHAQVRFHSSLPLSSPVRPPSVPPAERNPGVCALRGRSQPLRLPLLARLDMLHPPWGCSSRRAGPCSVASPGGAAFARSGQP